MQNIGIKSEIQKLFGYEFIKTKGEDLYVHLLRSGIIYQMDKTLPLDNGLVFNRIDSTRNYNYNIGSYVYEVGDDIYEIGGYGFWKSNGVLRKYNFKSREWDVIVTNKEVFAPNIASGHICWVDSSGSSLYVPFERITNDGVEGFSEGGIYVPSAHRLDIRKNHWEELGKLDPDVLDIFKFASVPISVSTGLLLCYTTRVYWINYVTNQISVYDNPVLAQTLSRINPNFLYFNHRDWVYWYQPSSSRYDSLQIDFSKFRPYGKPIWKKGWSWFQFSSFGLLIAIVIGGTAWWKWGKRKAATIATSKMVAGTEQPFSATEVSLLQLLINKTKQNQTANIEEINYVLGTKEKNPGMQKKVRSDIINSINEKFRLLNGSSESLIQSIRSESDKRYFEYQIRSKLLTEIDCLLG